eukprot:scaffold2022_cov387-Prasinococcus_capsulatus_cf.AAC.5
MHDAMGGTWIIPSLVSLGQPGSSALRVAVVSSPSRARAAAVVRTPHRFPTWASCSVVMLLQSPKYA